MAYKFAYRHGGRLRWFTIGLVSLADARKKAIQLRAEVRAEGRDPQAEKVAARSADSFAALHARYLREKAQKKNKSWQQPARLVERYLLPRWGKRPVKSITRADVRAVFGAIEAPILANQILSAASAVFTFGVKQEVLAHNPATGIEKNPTHARDRVLEEEEGEFAPFWAALAPRGRTGAALKLILLTAQRPGEVINMRFEHIQGNWWILPGEPQANGWPGTKSGKPNKVWLSPTARELIGSGEGRVFAEIERLPEAMREISALLGFKPPVRPHDLRRTCATLLSELLDKDQKTLDKILNHADRTVTERHYDKYKREREIKSALERVSELVLDLAEGRRRGAVVRGPWPREGA
jgi:integrase